MGFYDHFPGTSLDARWTAVTGGTGAVTVTDSYVNFARPSATDVAYAYYNTELSKSTNQLWVICGNVVASGWRRLCIIRNTATPGTAIPFGTTDHVIQVQLATAASVYYVQLEYYNASGTRQIWNPATQAWGTGSPNSALARINLDDYVEVGIEFNADTSSFRLMCWTVAGAGSRIQDQGGPRLMQLTNWVLWSNTNTAQDDLYLFLNHPYNDIATDTNVRFEYVHFENGARELAYANGKVDGGSYDIRQFWTYGKRFVKRDRTTVSLDNNTGGTWDDDHVKDPMVVEDENTQYMFYSGFDGSLYQIGVAVSVDKGTTWTRPISTPIIPRQSTGFNYQVYAPFVIKDLSEPDPKKTWKMMFAGTDSGFTTQKIFCAYTSHPLSKWTVQRQPVLEAGAAGAWDEDGVASPVVYFCGGMWELYYAGAKENAGTWLEYQIGRAVSKGFGGPYIKDSGNPKFGPQADGKQNLSGTMTGRVGTVTDTTGFRVDGLVVIDNDTTADNWNVTRIRAIVTNTSIEFLHELDGFGATANVRMIDAWRRFVPRAIRKVGSEWQLWGVAFGQYLDDSANFDAFWECTLLLKHSGAGGPGSGTWAVDDLYTPGITVDDFGFDRSAENITFVTLPVLRGIPDKNIIKRNFEHPVLPGTMEIAGGL